MHIGVVRGDEANEDDERDDESEKEQEQKRQKESVCSYETPLRYDDRLFRSLARHVVLGSRFLNRRTNPVSAVRAKRRSLIDFSAAIFAKWHR